MQSYLLYRWQSLSQRSVLLLLVMVGWKESRPAESIKKSCTSPQEPHYTVLLWAFPLLALWVGFLQTKFNRWVSKYFRSIRTCEIWFLFHPWLLFIRVLGLTDSLGHKRVRIPIKSFPGFFMHGLSSSTGWAFDAAFSSAEHSALPCIFTEDLKIPFKVSLYFCYFIQFDHHIWLWGQRSRLLGGSINCIWKLCFSRKLV